jgi:membrane-bound ClpP family serine protease
MRKMMAAAKHPVTTGPQGMIRKTGQVLWWSGQAGKVRCYDEVWDARTEGRQGLSRGEKVKVVGMQDLRMVVLPLEGGGIERPPQIPR